MKTAAALLAGMFIAGVASAAPITTAATITHVLDRGTVLTGLKSDSYSHDLSAGSFVLDSATSATLSIALEVDFQRYLDTCATSCNTALLPNFQISAGDTYFPRDGVWSLGADAEDVVFSVDLEAGSLADLNADGILDLRISMLSVSRGTLTIGRSLLSVEGDITVSPPPPPLPLPLPPASVTEPATVSLLGLGLLAAGALRRRRTA